jgi:excisionase family DNA binding protein
MPDDVIPIRCPVCNCDSNAAAWDNGCPTCAVLQAVKDCERRELAAEIAKTLGGKLRSSPQKELFGMREAAKKIGINRSETLKAAIAEGKIRTVRFRGRVKIPRSEIERINNGGDDAPAAPAGGNVAKPPRRRSPKSTDGRDPLDSWEPPERS